MVKKTLQLLKQNPVLVLLYLGVQVITQLIMFLLYPKTMSDFGITENAFDFQLYFLTLGKLLIVIIVVYIIGLLFYSGYGNMLREAILRGKAGWKAFGDGIASFFVRILLSSLLLGAMAVGASIPMMIIAIPIAVGTTLNGSMDGIIITPIITTIILDIVIPLILLWLPAIFIDDTGVIQGMKNGFRAGVKNYWKLLLLVLLISIPMIIIFVVNSPSTYSVAGTNETILSPGYYVISIIEGIFASLFIPYIFMLYHNYVSNKIVYYNNES